MTDEETVTINNKLSFEQNCALALAVFAHKLRADSYKHTLEDISYEGENIGTWEISVKRKKGRIE